MATKAHNTLTDIVKGHLLAQGFQMDGSDAIIDIFDEVYDFVLADHDAAPYISRLILSAYYDFDHSYEDVATFITENLA